MKKIVLILSIILFVKSLTPLSECTKGRITGFNGYENGGSCGFGIPKMYGGSANEDNYNNAEKCGICYEVVGSKGAFVFMVDSYCPKEGNEEICGGDMLHFDLHKNGFNTIVDEGLGIMNMTFRMVACPHKGNIILKTRPIVSEFYFGFFVMNYVIGLRKVYYSFDKQNWQEVPRQWYNEMTIDRVSSLPLYLQFESITGEKVTTQIDEIKRDFMYDTGVQFSIPEDKYFDVKTLKEIPNPKKEECCKLNDAYTDIYADGKFLGEWFDISGTERNLEHMSGCYHEGKKCIRVRFTGWSYFQFFNRIQPKTEKYEAIEFYIKSEKECENCLRIKTGDHDFFYFGTSAPGIWEKKVIKLSELGVIEEKFKNFLFILSRGDSHVLYFDDIKLVKSSNEDKGVCSRS